MPLSVGTGLRTSTVTELLSDESLVLTASTVTAFGFGTLAGALKNPTALIVPVEALPPTTLLTDHVTVLLDAPVTVAANCCVAPTRTLALVGEIVTAGFEPPVPPPEPPPEPPEEPFLPLLTVPQLAVIIMLSETHKIWSVRWSDFFARSSDCLFFILGSYEAGSPRSSLPI
jgi:hypothetical protein